VIHQARLRRCAGREIADGVHCLEEGVLREDGIDPREYLGWSKSTTLKEILLGLIIVAENSLHLGNAVTDGVDIVVDAHCTSNGLTVPALSLFSEIAPLVSQFCVLPFDFRIVALGRLFIARVGGGAVFLCLGCHGPSLAYGGIIAEWWISSEGPAPLVSHSTAGKPAIPKIEDEKRHFAFMIGM
jgi:hypothetical protein